MKYCCEEFKDYVEGCVFRKENKKWGSVDGEDGHIEFYIKYCPFCGKELK